MQGVLRTNLTKGTGLIISMILVIICMIGSIILSLTHVTLGNVIDAYTHFSGSNQHIIIRQERVPRALIGVAVGASLAIAGALMQGLTRNPLASPNILGVNAGASFFIVIAVTFFGITSLSTFTWLAFLERHLRLLSSIPLDPLVERV